MAVVDSSAKSVFVGFGTFAWRPWTSRDPRTGEVRNTWHLSFRPCRYREGKYKWNYTPGLELKAPDVRTAP